MEESDTFPGGGEDDVVGSQQDGLGGHVYLYREHGPCLDVRAC
jgi:hypothetical protein